ncbi:Eco57I restriction-modification methylase domain-containing protein [Patulibacter sp. S7RM1-6]
MSTFAGLFSAPLAARDLGARGSRGPVGDSDPAASLGPASLAVLAAVPAWWEGRARTAGLTGAWLDIEHALEVELPDGIRSVRPDAAITPDTLPDEIGAAYAASLDPGTRARHGRHYTPLPLAEHLWAMTRAALGHGAPYRSLRGLVRDPACGAGVLLLPALREHLGGTVRADARVALAGLPNFIEGIDADPAAVWIANATLAAEALPLLAAVPARRRRPLPALAHVGDGLQAGRRPARAVIMNPPYGRVKLPPSERERFSKVLYGHANLYTLFMAAGVEDLDQNGVLSALVPTSFTAGRYFATLRAELSQTAPLRDVAFVAQRDGVFAGVLQETCLAVFTKKKPRKTAIATINGQVSTVAQVRSPRGELPWLLPRRSDDAHIAAAAAAMSMTLLSAGWRASTGPLVWNRRRADLSAKRGAGRVPIVWAADLDGGTLHRDPSRDAMRFITLRDAADHGTFVLEEPAILVQRTTAPEQSRRVVSAQLTAADLERWGGAVVVENHVNVLRPLPGGEPVLSAEALATVLATQTIDQVMRCLAGSVALSAYELGALPLPSRTVLAEWSTLGADELRAAVADAYRPAVT